MLIRNIVNKCNILSKHVKKMSSLKKDTPIIDERIVWVDLEMTGLDIEKDHILEVACLITDSELSIVAEGPHLVIHQPENILKNMNPWCIDHHGKTGLTAASKESKISITQAESILLKFVQSNVSKGICPLAGNSVYIDRLFIRKYLPSFDDYLHYRIIDVSTVKELCRRWYSKEFKEQPSKKFSHRALDDIKESIEELKYYKSAIFKKK